MSESFDSEDFGYWTLDIDTGLATIAKLQDLVLQANSLESQIISMIQSEELELPNLLNACVDLANFQLELRSEIKHLKDHIDAIRQKL